MNRPNHGVKVAAVVWLAAVVAATIVLLDYAGSPGPAAAAPLRWPAASALPFEKGRPNLVLFAHPRCPCTRATLGELEILMARHPGQFAVQVGFGVPIGAGADWNDTPLWRKASAIPGVAVHRDEGMAEARRFGAATSGQVMLFDGGGQRLFEGGITISRGHAGDNPGRRAVEALLTGSLSPGVRTPVFGCPLFSTDCQQGEITCTP